jgi:(p)ppGpp synthase/HD superfamily hydrolase
MKLSTQEMLDRAATISARVHQGQLRKDGTPYIAHPIRVAMRVKTDEERIVALLHDAVEDTPLTIEDLRGDGFSERVLSGIDSVTKRPGEKYTDFIQRAKVNEIGRVVKVADIQDNLADQSALDPDEAAFLKKRYTNALDELCDWVIS